MAASSALCAQFVRNRRGLLALSWSIISFVNVFAFLFALVFAISGLYLNSNTNKNDDDDYPEEDEEEASEYHEISVTSKAMAFAAIWTVIVSIAMSIFGTIVLGVQSLSGQYYTCCAGSVHRTSQTSVGIFIGALLMFANMTLVCSVMFGEFEIRDYRYNRNEDDAEEGFSDTAIQRSSAAFSILCLFLTVMYAGFAALVFTFHDDIIRENLEDAREDSLRPSEPEGHTHKSNLTLHPSGRYKAMGDVNTIRKPLSVI
eukprot:CAMPEP_0194361784 /NCGR_PEP_ID=MMETSP0174-20130528/9385_1 /TAXON_ID=216777 /ORGANISM="Proboscia alata, Strain PI-D3" /LENGTH=257 /DNA_ID=CAMNT_0039134185 /DNA_START=109 /DNA_END=882 /DNA_ORIENTATION=-